MNMTREQLVDNQKYQIRYSLVCGGTVTVNDDHPIAMEAVRALIAEGRVEKVEGGEEWVTVRRAPR